MPPRLQGQPRAAGGAVGLVDGAVGLVIGGGRGGRRRREEGSPVAARCAATASWSYVARPASCFELARVGAGQHGSRCAIVRFISGTRHRSAAEAG